MPYTRGSYLDRRHSVALIAQDQAQVRGPVPSGAGLPPVIQLDQPNPRPRPPYFHEVGQQGIIPNQPWPPPPVDQPNPRPRPPYFHEAGPAFVPSGTGLPPVVQVDQPNPRGRPAYFHELGAPAALFTSPFTAPLPDQPNPRQRPPYFHEVGQWAPSLAPFKVPTYDWPLPVRRPPYFHDVGQWAPPMSAYKVPTYDWPLPVRRPLYFHDVGQSVVPVVPPFIAPLPDQPNPRPRAPYFHEAGPSFTPSGTGWPVLVPMEFPNPLLLPWHKRTIYDPGRQGLDVMTVVAVFRRTLSQEGTRVGERQEAFPGMSNG